MPESVLYVMHLVMMITIVEFKSDRKTLHSYHMHYASYTCIKTYYHHENVDTISNLISLLQTYCYETIINSIQ